jgi:hypothetical protein
MEEQTETFNQLTDPTRSRTCQNKTERAKAKPNVQGAWI